MANLKRYERHTWFDGDGDDFHNMRPASDGEWVKFEDVEEFLKTSNNSASRAIVLSQDDAGGSCHIEYITTTEEARV